LLLSLILLSISTPQIGIAQSADLKTLQEQLANSRDIQEQMNLNFEIGEVLLEQRDYKESSDYSEKAFDLARSKNNKNMMAQAAYQVYEASVGLRNVTKQNYWLKRTLDNAKVVGDSDLIIKATAARSRNWTRQGNYRQAYLLNEEIFQYFSQKGTSISELERKYEAEQQRLNRERTNIERQKNQLAIERDTLTAEISRLSSEKDQLSSSNEILEEQTEQLAQENQEARQQVTQTAQELQTVSRQKRQVEAKVAISEEQIASLSRDTLELRYKNAEDSKELMKKQMLVERQQAYLYIAGIGLLSLLLISMTLFSRFRTKKRSAKILEKKNQEIETERKRSDELLLNILPVGIAEELKQKGAATARKYDEVTVFFSDFKNFTSIAEKMSPESLVEELDTIFRKFDEIIGKYSDIEKIKTIGDSYMCASGFSDRKSLPTSLIKAALEMQSYLRQYQQKRMRQGKPFFEARMGLHTGPVVAGVVGSKKFAYDIWGDTVNTASRMESNGLPGQVNISQTTYDLVKYGFKCAPRGKIEAKNKGYIDMYFVESAFQG
ncbi:MAG: adenylate/guanylate cyclase domain-containing protein, partial [Bacteroidota bacterium]